MQRLTFTFALALVLALDVSSASASCAQTGFLRDGINMTAALINPPGTVSGEVDATGCNVGIYYDHTGTGGTVKGADVHGANYFGVFVNGDGGTVNVDVLTSTIRDIGEVTHNGAQHGVAIYYRGFFPVSGVTGRLSGNTITAYQKGGIVANGQGTQVNITGNVVTGDGDVDFIAQNGIQVGYGATASVMRNRVSNNSYVGFPGDGSASGGIIVVGGAGYGICPDGGDCPLTVNARINDNILANNDVGIYLSNLDVDGAAPADATNVKAVNNTVSNDGCHNTSYMAGISDVGNNDKIIGNTVSGYACTTGGYSVAIDADPSFTERPKVHANQ